MPKAVQRVVDLLVLSVLGLVLSAPAYAVGDAWYVGLGAGMSRLSPDTDGSDFALDDDASVAAGVYLGLDINDWLAAELAYTSLGEASLSGGQTIGYSAMSIGGIAYLFGQRDLMARQQGLSGYLRLGLNSIANDASVELEAQDNVALWLGAGLQWPIGRQWGVRGELTSFDGDAQAAMASLYWRSMPDSRTIPRRIESQPRPVTAPRAERQPAVAPAPQPTPPPVPQPAPNFNTTSDCIAPTLNEPRDSQGCALLTGVVAGVDFQADTDRLTPVAQALLSRLAVSLNQYPDLVVEVQVHTQVYAEPARAMQLARARVLTVARYLAGQSVDVSRLRARAFGSTQPRADNDTAGGRRLNNRVAVRVLP